MVYKWFKMASLKVRKITLRVFTAMGSGKIVISLPHKPFQWKCFLFWQQQKWFSVKRKKK